MQSTKYIALFIMILSGISGCCQNPHLFIPVQNEKEVIRPGAYLLNEYLHLLKDKKVGIIANNTSLVNNTHLVDTLKSLGVHVVKIFSPEHGFRGNQPDGKEISNTVDPKTGIEIISLYGNHKRPSKSDINNIEILLFDIQDVGARFYTYISSLTYVMEACAENNIPLIITDRPNPNGYYVDGPVLEPGYESFVGLHSVPIVYGMTIGEYALMVNGEKWLKERKTCSITIIKCDRYTHKSRYQLSVRPSPNLHDMKAVYLYPSLCLFEGTVVSIGRGTENPFKIFGHPKFISYTYSFTPKPIKGISEDPPLKHQLCYGQNLSDAADSIRENGHIVLSWLIETYKTLNIKNEFFNDYFNKLAGNNTLQEQITAGLSEKEIRKSWEPTIEKFKKIRIKYLLYPDFE